ncbi:MAG: trypsin-like peptidase domain-containing protein [Pirellulales bacterium]|nr:trypsin-like peptidase domain-containing protein [Pirellulales bacterium]
MSKAWYYLRDGVRHGPVSSQQLSALAYARKIAPSDLVWCEGLADWTPAAKVKGLFTMPAPPPPPGPNRGADRGSHVRSAGSNQSAPASRPTRQLPEWKEVIAHRLPQVVVIQHSCYIGAGLLISAEGLILTVAHLVGDASVVHIDFADNTVTRGLVIDLDSEHDLALVKAASVSRPFLDLHTDVAESVEAGEAIVAIGHPRGHRFTSTSGIVSAPRRRTPAGILIQHDVPSNSGSSGGPLIDRAGKLVGIVTSGLTDAQGMGFAVPAVEARAYVDRVMKEFVKGKRKVPDDEEILEYGIRIHSAHAVNRALGLFEEVKCIEENSYVVTTSRGTVLLLYSSDEQVEVLYSLGRLKSSAKNDATFLAALLHLNSNFPLSRFTLWEDRHLWLRASCPLNGIDVAQLGTVVSDMEAVLSEHLGELQNYLEPADNEQDDDESAQQEDDEAEAQDDYEDAEDEDDEWDEDEDGAD